MDESLLSPSYSRGIMHSRHICKYRAVSFVLLSSPIHCKIQILTSPSFPIGSCTGARTRQNVQVWGWVRGSKSRGEAERSSQHSCQIREPTTVLRAYGGTWRGWYCNFLVLHLDVMHVIHCSLSCSGRKLCVWLLVSPWITGSS